MKIEEKLYKQLAEVKEKMTKRFIKLKNRKQNKEQKYN